MKNLKIILIVGLLSLFQKTIANEHPIQEGKWVPKGNSDLMSICAQDDHLIISRISPSGREEKFTIPQSAIMQIKDLNIIDLEFKKRTIYKLVLVKRGKQSLAELIGDLHFYMNGLTHMNVFDIHLQYSDEDC